MGDAVLSRDQHHADDPVGVQYVEEVFKRQAEILILTVSGHEIRTTAEHPFYIIGKGWLIADELEVGDRFASHNESGGVLESIQRVGEHVDVYNFRVSNWHTYFVGQDDWGFSVWAHNADYEWFVHDSHVFLRDVEGNLIRTPYTESNLQAMMGDAKLTRIEPPAKINPDRFLNQQPHEVLGPHPNIVRDPIEFAKRGNSKRYDYVVLEDGTLVVGESTPNVGHANLAQGRPVKAAGMIQFHNGQVLYIDNASGHYVPIGGKAQFAALDAFDKIGVEIPTGLYIPKRWNDITQLWEPIK